MVFIEANHNFFVIASLSKINVFKNSEKIENFELVLPDLNLKQKDKKYDKNLFIREDNPVCGKFSNDGLLMAICDIYKRLIIWKTNDKLWEIMNIFDTGKKVVQILFLKDNKTILVGDKSCDIYKYDLETGKSNLLFGHISMLLDMKICNEEKFIVTCDRDEKIKVTNYPYTFNIQSYCLGHTEFVNTCSFIDKNHIITGSGDLTIKLWNFLEGKELFSFDLNSLINQNEDRIAVKKIFYINSMVVVTFFNFNKLITLKMDEQKLIYNQTILLPSVCLDVVLVHEKIYLLTSNDGLISFQFKGNNLEKVENYFLSAINNKKDSIELNQKEALNFHLLYKFPNDKYNEELNEKKKLKN